MSTQGHLPRVSIITINFNGTGVTRDLLLSLRKCTYPDLEIVVVDNGSKVPCFELKNEFPEIVFVNTEANLGFAGGNNKGIELSTGDCILLLNNDTEVDPGFLEPLVHRLMDNSTIGVICPKILYFDEPDTIQFAGFGPIHPVTGRGFSVGYLEKDTGQHDKPGQTNRPHGAAMMMPRLAIEKVGLMAEIFFLYYEEMDYGERFKRKGFTIWYEPASRIWHKESMATGKESTLKAYYYGRNRFLYTRRNVNGINRIFAFLYYLLFAVPRNLLKYAFRGEWKHFKAFLRGVIWNFRHGKDDQYDK